MYVVVLLTVITLAINWIHLFNCYHYENDSLTAY